MNQVPVYILAGGRSSRFGSDKARALVDGEPLILRVQRLLAPISLSVTAVAERAEKYADLGLRTIPDVHPGLGPLAGLEASLTDLPHGEDWLLLCSCDALVVHRHWLDRLVEARAEGFDAVAFRGEHWQPMPALYARSCQPLVQESLDQRRLSMHGLLDRAATRALPLPIDWPEDWQANSPADLPPT